MKESYPSMLILLFVLRIIVLIYSEPETAGREDHG